MQGPGVIQHLAGFHVEFFLANVRRQPQEKGQIDDAAVEQGMQAAHARVVSAPFCLGIDEFFGGHVGRAPGVIEVLGRFEEVLLQ